jgi:D-alanyl-D-alanine carboxypeptidase
VVQTSRGFDANFVGMSEEEAALACRRLAARSLSCEPLSPG